MAFASLLPLLWLPASAAAQEQPSPWVTVFSDRVDISNQPAFEKASAGFVDLFEGAGIEDVSWVTIQSAELGYVYAISGTGPGDMEEMDATWKAALDALGEPGRALMAESDALVSSREALFLVNRSDLSYRPETVGLDAELPYRRYTELYVHPSKAQEFEAIMREWAAAYEAHGVERGWRTLQYLTGTDLPRYLIVERGADPAQFEAESARIREVLGEDQKRLYEKTGPMLRSVKDFDGWIRGDLSYPRLSPED